MTWTLLHDACEHLDAKRIYDRCQLGTNEPLEVDDHGSTPLHILAWGNPEPDLLQTLIDCCPAAVTDKDVHGDTCLHVACSYPQTDVKVVKTLLDSCPALASITNKEGLMPLHTVCRYAPNNEAVIGCLIQAYPSALRSRIRMGNPAPPRKRRSQTTKEQPPKGGGDSHFVTPHERTNFADIRFQSLSTQIRDGAYPLHMAIKSRASKAVLQMLIKGADDVLLMTNKFGETPLHLALAATTSRAQDGASAVEDDKEVVELLVDQCSNALKLRDKTQQKNLPIHVAAIHGCTVRVAKALLQNDNLDSVHEKNAEGRTPLDLALEFKRCDEAVLRLLESSSDDSEVAVE